MIKLFQLVTGEMVIGEVGEKEFTEGSQVELVNPLFVIAQPDEQNHQKINIRLMPYANLAAENTVNLVFKNVVWHADPENGLKNQYQNIFSKIVTPPDTTKIVT